MKVLNFTGVKENLCHTAPYKTCSLFSVHMVVNYTISSRQWKLAKDITLSLNTYTDTQEGK